MIQYLSHVMNGMESNGLVLHQLTQHGLFVVKKTATSALLASKLAPRGSMDKNQKAPELTLCVVLTPAKPVKTVSCGTEDTGKVFHLFIQLGLNVV